MKKMFELFVIAGLRIAKIPGHLSGVFVIFSVPAVGNLSGNLYPRVGPDFSILLEPVNVVSF